MSKSDKLNEKIVLVNKMCFCKNGGTDNYGISYHINFKDVEICSQECLNFIIKYFDIGIKVEDILMEGYEKNE